MNKPGIVQKSLEGISETVTVTQKFDELTEPLVELMKSSNSKVSSNWFKNQQAAATVFIHLLGQFGIKKFKVKDLCAGFEKLVGDKKKEVKALGMQIYEELYKFMKEGVMGLVDKLEKWEQEELKKSFERMKAEGVKAPEQKVLITDRNKEESKGEEPEAQQDQQESFDPYEFADEKDCLANYNEEWAEKLVACPKWD